MEFSHAATRPSLGPRTADDDATLAEPHAAAAELLTPDCERGPRLNASLDSSGAQSISWRASAKPDPQFIRAVTQILS
jgi:hypothetical protein